MIKDCDIALVTGAGRGIGRAIALALARHGAKVVLCSRTFSELEQVRSEIANAGGESLALPCDVTDEQQVRLAFERASVELGPIDILVNSAGIRAQGRTELVDYSIAEWDRVYNGNFLGMLNSCRLILPAMRRTKHGTIINVISIDGLKVVPDLSPDCVSRFSEVGLTQSLIAENCSFGIRVAMVCPGPTYGHLTQGAVNSSREKDPGRTLKPEDVAGVVVFLCDLPDNVRIDWITVLPNQFPLEHWDSQPR